MRTLTKILLTLCLPMLAASCHDDTYRFPSAVREFFVAHTASDSTIFAIDTDDGLRLSVIDDQTQHLGTPDSAYRCVGYYEHADGGVLLYSASNVIASHAVAAHHLDTLCTDPVQLVSIWKAPRYLNMRLGLRHGGAEHEFQFVSDSIVRPVHGGSVHAYFSLYHDAAGDIEAFTDFVYASLPLENYLGAYPRLVVHFAVNTYDEGLKRYEFDYNR